MWCHYILLLFLIPFWKCFFLFLLFFLLHMSCKNIPYSEALAAKWLWWAAMGHMLGMIKKYTPNKLYCSLGQLWNCWRAAKVLNKSTIFRFIFLLPLVVCHSVDGVSGIIGGWCHCHCDCCCQWMVSQSHHHTVAVSGWCHCHTITLAVSGWCHCHTITLAVSGWCHCHTITVAVSGWCYCHTITLLVSEDGVIVTPSLLLSEDGVIVTPSHCCCQRMVSLSHHHTCCQLMVSLLLSQDGVTPSLLLSVDAVNVTSW